MSAPSSDGDGRPSVSSEPSAASSRTLNSRWSSAHEDNDNGEGGSRQRANDGLEGTSRSSESPLEGESIEELDFAHRRHRNRRSGGFLLDSSFASGPATARQHHHGHSLSVEDAKGKGSSRHGRTHNSSRHSARVQTGLGEPASRSSLSREYGADQHRLEEDARADAANGPGYDGQLYPQKTRTARLELPSSIATQDAPQPNRAPAPALDPNEIIKTALKLSAERRRNVSDGQLIAPQPTGSRRVASIAVRQDGSFREPSTGGSLRQYLNDQRRVSRNISPFGAKQKPEKFNPTGETLARAQKFRASVELRLEYLRLLEYLPPLKPDMFAPGNFIVTANNVPGSSQAFLTRVPSHAGKQHELGRPYNPLQYLRDRRCRARERKSLDIMPEDFSDPTKVHDWVDRVGEGSGRPEYRRQDGVALPPFHKDHASDAVPSRSTRHRVGWNFTIEELIADALWLEQDGNKHLIEDRYGHKVFPEEPKKQDFLQPRASKEYPEKRRKSWVDSISGVAVDPTTGDESDPPSERGRKRRLLPPFRADSPGHKKHGWRGSVSRTRLHSDSSDSESDARSRRHRSRENRSPEKDPTINTGALSQHLKGMLEQEAEETRAKSPGVVSPDTPDKWGVGYRTTRDSASPRSSMDTTGYTSGYTDGSVTGPYPVLKVPPIDSNTLSSNRERRGRSSFEDPDGTPPSTPLHLKNFANVDTSTSPPSSRGGDIKRSVKSKLDIFRSDDSVRGHKHDIVKTDSDLSNADKKGISRPPTEDGLGSAVKSLLSHKHNESINSVNSLKYYRDAKEPKDPSSAVTRFFKGVKNEGSKVGEFIFKRDRPAEDTDTDSLATDNAADRSDMEEENIRPVIGRSAAAAASAGSLVSKPATPGGYHVELPTFRPQNDQETGLTDDHVTNQSRARANSRSARFDRLAPPRMDLGSISSRSSTGSPEATRDRPRNGLLFPDDRPRGLSITSLTGSTFSETSSLASRPHFEGRHWSITDEDVHNTQHKWPRRRTVTTAPGSIISTSDIARIRALFLSSGIKAREITRRAHEKRQTPPAFLTEAAKAANAELIPIPRMEEHALAARILVRNLEASTTSLQDSAETYRTSTVESLTSLISGLKSRVESELFPAVRESGDEALRITSEVSAAAPLSVKQLSDEIDKMVRMRRRRMRWVRRVGWMVVEWMLLGIMWWVWLVVVVVGLGKRVVGVGWGVVRWLLWI